MSSIPLSSDPTPPLLSWASFIPNEAQPFQVRAQGQEQGNGAAGEGRSWLALRLTVR